MKKKLLLLMLPLVMVFMFSANKLTFAHVSNELQIYKDLANSPAKEEIVKFRAFGIIPNIEGEENFEPTSELNKETLASWLAKAANLKGHTESPTPEEYAEEAVESGFIDSLDGNATLADVVAGILRIIGVRDVENPAEQAEELGILQGEWHDP